MPDGTPAVPAARVELFQRQHQSGVATLVFTDIVGSTRLKQSLGDHRGVALIQHHHALVRAILATYPGAEEISTAGDSFLLVFAQPSEAVRFALRLQAGLRDLSRETGHALSDRLGIHVGEVLVTESDRTPLRKDLFGIQVDTCARVMALGGPGQILMTRFAFDNARQVLKGLEAEGIGQLCWVNHGPYRLKGVEEPIEICEVGESGVTALAPPGNSEQAQRFARPGEEPVLGWRPAIGQAVADTHWILDEKLGEGGFGEVWKATHRQLGEPRVFKFCFRADRVRSLKREVTLFRLLKERVGDHPNIVRVHDVFLDQPPYYLAEEYVAGKDLKTWCDRCGGVESIPLAVRLELVAQIADALQAAHDAGVIHRDVKPGNILIVQPAGPGQPASAKLTDFGIGQVLSQESLANLTAAGFTMTLLSGSSSPSGTQLYMAPELFANKPASTRSDIFSLGVVLYQLLVADLTRPLTTDWADNVADPLLREDLRRCFAGNPQDRFPAAGQLAQHLRSLEQRQAALEQQRADQALRERRAYRRGIVQTAAVGALVVLAFAGTALYATLQRRQAESSARIADEQRADAVVQKSLAQEKAEESRKRLVRLNVAYGLQLMDQGDLVSSLHWFVEALRLETGDRQAEDTHRARIAAVLQQCPRLLEAWWYDAGITHAEFSPDGRQVAVSLDDGTARWFDADTHQATNRLVHHREAVRWVTFSRDGRRVATASQDHTARVWERATAQPLTPPLAHEDAVHSVGFSPDGRRVVTASEDASARLWDAGSGRLLVPPLRHAKAVYTAHFSPDGSLVVTASEDGTARIWDAGTGQAASPPLRHAAEVRDAVFSPDGRLVITASEDGTGQVWDARTGGPVGRPLRHTTWLTSASFSPDSRLALTTSFDASARVWDVTTGRQALPTLNHPHSVLYGCFSPEGRRIATACFNQTVLVWDAVSGELSVPPLKQSGFVSSAVFAPDCRRVLAIAGDRTMRLWDLAVGANVAVTLEHDARVNVAAFNPEGTLVVTASADHTARVWDALSGRAVLPALRLEGAVNNATFSPDGSQILTASEDGTAQLWETATGRRAAPPLLHAGPVKLARFDRTGRRVFTAAYGGETHPATAGVWDARTAQLLSPLLQLGPQVSSVAFSPDGKRVVAGTRNGLAQLWETATGRPTGKPMEHRTNVVDVSFSPDGSKVLTCCQDEGYAAQSARVWDASTGAPLTPPLEHRDGVVEGEFSPDGRRVVTASEDGTAALWDARTGRLVAPFLRHSYQVQHATFSPDGRRVVTASRDRTARVWDAFTGEPVTPPLRHSGRVWFGTFNAAGSRLVTCSEDGRAKLWNVEKDDRPLADLALLADLLNCASMQGNPVERQTGTVVPLQSTALHEVWVRLQAKYPAAFETPPREAVAWHLHEAEAAIRSRDPAAALRHLEDLLAREPTDPVALRLRSVAETQLRAPPQPTE